MIYDPNSTEVNSDDYVLEHLVNDTSEQMPLSLLPEPFKQMSEAISHSARVPQSLAGCCVLGAAHQLTSLQIAINPKGSACCRRSDTL